MKDYGNILVFDSVEEMNSSSGQRAIQFFPIAMVIPPAPTLNRELIEKVRDIIVKHPHNVYMSSWASNGVLSLSEIENNTACKTTGCIAGWTLAISEGKFDENEFRGDIVARAGKYLGLPREKAHMLFHVSSWPPQFQQPYRKLYQDRFKKLIEKDYLEKKISEIIVARLNHLLKTGE